MLSCSKEDLNYILNPKTRTLVCLSYTVYNIDSIYHICQTNSLKSSALYFCFLATTFQNYKTEVLHDDNCLQVKGADSFSIFTKAQKVPAGLRVGLDIFTTDLTTFIHHLQFQAIVFFLSIFSQLESFVSQLSLFCRNLPDEDVPCRLFIFTPTAWIQVEDHKRLSYFIRGGL